MRRYAGTLLFLLTVFAAAPFTARAEEPDLLAPAVTDDDSYTVDPEENEPETAERADEPMDPALDRPGRRAFRAGSILEFWMLKPDERFVRMPPDPSLTGMIDDGRQWFYAGAMLRDAEMKNYAGRQGVLQWTTYFRVTKPGKHVFALAAAGMDRSGTEYSGAALLVNDQIKILTPGNLEGSAVADFAAAGWYKIQVRLWWTHGENPRWEDYTVSLKVREPGTLSLRQFTRKELFYLNP